MYSVMDGGIHTVDAYTFEWYYMSLLAAQVEIQVVEGFNHPTLSKAAVAVIDSGAPRLLLFGHGLTSTGLTEVSCVNNDDSMVVRGTCKLGTYDLTDVYGQAQAEQETLPRWDTYTFAGTRTYL